MTSGVNPQEIIVTKHKGKPKEILANASAVQ
jgi:hypothetical protein